MTKNWIYSVHNTKQIFITALLLLLSILFFAFSSFDMQLQDLFYSFDTKAWILDRHAQPYAFIFYWGIKRLLILFAIVIFILLFLTKKYPTLLLPYRKGLIIVLLSAIIVPSVSVKLKSLTNMPCPKNEIHYGGKYPHTAVWEKYEAPYTTMKHIKCWPAGHASGGFALMSLFFLFKRRKNRYFALAGGVILGWTLGIYKMLIGDHFFSHTLISMLLAWLLILLIVKVVAYFNKTRNRWL